MVGGCEAYLVTAIGLLLAMPGLALALVADRLEENPLVGFRIGYAYTSRRAWVRANRFAGAVFAFAGFASIAIGLAFGPIAQVVFLAVATPFLLIVMVAYASSIAEKTLLSEPSEKAEPLRVEGPDRPGLVASTVLVGFMACVLAGVRLVAEGLTAAGAVVVVSAAPSLYLAYLSLSRPEAYYQPWLSPEQVRTIATLAPIAYSVADLSVALFALGLEGVGAVFLTASIATVLWILVIVVGAYNRYRRRRRR